MLLDKGVAKQKQYEPLDDGLNRSEGSMCLILFVLTTGPMKVEDVCCSYVKYLVISIVFRQLSSVFTVLNKRSRACFLSTRTLCS